jgi:glycosyltransferase involved in cell wall biosynthesis
MTILSIITPASRGIKYLSQLFRDFNNQTLPKNQWDHIVVYDGEIPSDIQKLANDYKNKYQLILTSIKKDTGDMKISPGTKARNYGVNLSKSKFVAFADDDDRYRDTLCESFVSNCNDNTISLVQMSCQESRMFRNGDPNTIRLIPEIDLKQFPVCCHVGTPCFCLPREWALAEPWRHEPEHDYRFIKRICDKFHPNIRITGGMNIDVDGVVIKGMRDFVTIPPFYRD